MRIFSNLINKKIQGNTIPTGEKKDVPAGLVMMLVNDGWPQTETKDK